MKKLNKIDDFDFGFSFSDDSDTLNRIESNRSSDQQTIEDLTNRLHTLHKMILPLLDNLCRDPEKPSIHWPDRVSKIQDYKTKLLDIVEGRNSK